MDLNVLPFDAALERYERQSEDLLFAHGTGDPEAIRVIHHNHPRFLDPKILWLPRDMAASEIQSAPFDLADARLTLARWYSFLDWDSLAAHVADASRAGSAVHRFESAVEAVIHGDLETLTALLSRHPELVRARSMRVTHFDPPVHGATLLHYLAANGVEGYRQKSPPNAVEVARRLLSAGAHADAFAHMYGGEYATLSMLVSSSPPAEANVQVGLIDILADFGASLEPLGSPKWAWPLMAALAFGHLDAARALVRRGARADTLAAAAALGNLPRAEQFLPTASPETRHQAMALASQHGQAEIVRLLLDAGEDPNRYNPDGNHSHSTPLHQAALAGHAGVVRLLVERGARLDIEDSVYHGTPLGWALHSGQTAIAEYLRSRTR